MAAPRPVFRALASTVNAWHNCVALGNKDWRDRHEATIKRIERDFLPSGSGLDAGCEVDVPNSSGRRIVIKASFHHLDSHGCYDRWTDHNVIVLPTLLSSFDILVTGRDRHGIKDHLADVFFTALSGAYTESKESVT